MPTAALLEEARRALRAGPGNGKKRGRQVGNMQKMPTFPQANFQRLLHDERGFVLNIVRDPRLPDRRLGTGNGRGVAVLAEDRQSQILSLVNAHRSMSISELQQKFEVSRETIRRDLLALEIQGKVRRMHGGAISLGLSEPEMAVRQVINPQGKRTIGNVVAEMIPDGAAVILGGGTTLESVAEGLAQRRGLAVVTNSIPNCLRLSGRNGNRIHLLGGALQPENQTTLGRDAAEMLAGYYANFAVIGAGGISRQGEVMDYSREEAELYRLMLQSAETAIVVADHQKFGRVAPVRVESLQKAAYLVTDAEPEPAMAEVLGHLPVHVVVAAPTD